VASGVRTELDARSESVGKKIRDAELAKVPYMVVVGDKERESSVISVRRHGEGDVGSMAVPALAERVARESAR
jgi:threonyl-tRNA synthetase